MDDKHKQKMSSMKRKRFERGISDAVQFFASANTKLKFKGNEELLWALELIEKTAVTTGLEPDHITTLIDVAASSSQVETVSKRIIKSLIPSSVVPEAAVLKAVSWLCTRKPSISIQVLLVRWILVVYDHIDRMDSIHSLYGILFYFLHYRTLMPYICHLLYLLTRKEDVRLFRVRLLIQYQRDLGPQPYLTGLLSIYKHYFPKLVQIVVPRTYKINKFTKLFFLQSFFPTYDRKWSAVVRQVREQNGLDPQPDLSWHAALAERLNPAETAGDLLPSYRKRRKLDPIPVIHSQATQSTYNSLASKLGFERIPFVQVKTFKDVLKNMDSIEFPSQMGAVLRSDTLLHFLSFTKDPVAAARLQFWIAETFREELIDTFQEKTKERVRRFLEATKNVSDFLQEGIPTIDLVLSQFLCTWNGKDNAPMIFKLISRCPMFSFPVFYTAVLEPLKKLYFMSSVYFKCKVIMCLTELLRNHAANEWPRNQTVENNESCLCLFQKSVQDIDSLDAIIKLVKFVSKIILLACVDEKQHALLELCALDFLELVCSLHKSFGLPFVVLVEPRLFERLLISPHPVTVSRLCSVVCRYKENFSSLKAQQRSGEVDPLYRDERDEMRMISVCNQIILDFCNMLWRFKAYTTADKKSIFYFDPAAVDKQLADSRMNESLSVFRHQAFLPYSLMFFKQMHLGEAVDFTSIKDRKKEFLQYLEAHNIGGISEFIHVFIRNSSSRVSVGGTTQMMGISQTMSNTQMGLSSTHGNNSAFGF